MCRLFCFCIFFMSVTSYASSADLSLTAELARLPPAVNQLIVVSLEQGIRAKLQPFERVNGNWVTTGFGPFAALIGKNGLASEGSKREGDGKTPAGLYQFGMAFGYNPLALKLDYHYITSEDKFIDDPKSSDYNRWVSGASKAKSYEKMRLSDDSYKLGIIINYNMDPVVAGKGSAIFMHVWNVGGLIGTAGCIGVDEKNLYQLLNWLDKNQQPYILIRR